MQEKLLRNRFHGELLKRIVAEYRDGATTHELAFKYDTHQSTIARALKRVGCPLRATGRQPGKKARWGTSDKHRKASLKSMYGLTPAGYRGLHSEQGGKCAICGKELPSESSGSDPVSCIEDLVLSFILEFLQNPYACSVSW